MIELTKQIHEYELHQNGVNAALTSSKNPSKVILTNSDVSKFVWLDLNDLDFHQRSSHIRFKFKFEYYNQYKLRFKNDLLFKKKKTTYIWFKFWKRKEKANKLAKY